MTGPVVALKVDVDTYSGTRDGVPRLLGILERFGIRATFYFSMGPDNSGKAICRIFTRKGFPRRMLRLKGVATVDLKTMLYGTLLPPPLIADSFPGILRETEQRGHEVGTHCWDHVKWDDLLPWFPMPVTAMELGRASSAFERIFGRRARTTAAPGWMVSADSLEIQDAMGLDYCSDSRGSHPFYPSLEGRRFRTLQIPTTWPTVDEIVGRDGITTATVNDHYLPLLRPGLNVHTVHAEIEGGRLADVFADLLQRLLGEGVRFVTLGEAAAEFGADAPECAIEMGPLPGRAGSVAIQKAAVN